MTSSLTGSQYEDISLSGETESSPYAQFEGALSEYESATDPSNYASYPSESSAAETETIVKEEGAKRSTKEPLKMAVASNGRYLYGTSENKAYVRGQNDYASIAKYAEENNYGFYGTGSKLSKEVCSMPFFFELSHVFPPLLSLEQQNNRYVYASGPKYAYASNNSNNNNNSYGSQQMYGRPPLQQHKIPAVTLRSSKAKNESKQSARDWNGEWKTLLASPARTAWQRIEKYIVLKHLFDQFSIEV